MSSILHSFLRSNETGSSGDGKDGDRNSKNRRSSAPSMSRAMDNSSTPSTPFITAAAQEIKLSSIDVQSLIMNYLVVEGYKEAASHFINESENITESSMYTPMLDSMDSRQLIKEAILEDGDIPKAISLINDLNPEIMDLNPRLSFSLHQQMTMEHHHRGNVDECLEWAQDELAPRAIENPDLLRELEKTMTSVVFSSSSSSSSTSSSFSSSPSSSSLATLKADEEILFSRKQLATQVNNSLLNRKTSDATVKDEQVMMNCKLPYILKLLHLLQVRQSSKSITDAENATGSMALITDYASAL